MYILIYFKFFLIFFVTNFWSNEFYSSKNNNKISKIIKTSYNPNFFQQNSYSNFYKNNDSGNFLNNNFQNFDINSQNCQPQNSQILNYTNQNYSPTNSPQINIQKNIPTQNKNYNSCNQNEVLKKYFLWKKLVEFGAENFDEVANFILENDDWPLLKEIQKKSEKLLKNIRNYNYISFFNEHKPLSKFGAEYYLSGLISLNNFSEIKKINEYLLLNDIYVNESFNNVLGIRNSKYIKYFYQNAKLVMMIILGKIKEIKEKKVHNDDKNLYYLCLKLISKSYSAEYIWNNLSEEFKNNPLIIVLVLRNLRKNKFYEKMINILNWEERLVKSESELIQSAISYERFFLAKHLISVNKFNDAVNLLKINRLKLVNKKSKIFIKSSLLLGMISYSVLKNLSDSATAFLDVYKNSKEPQEKSSAAFWLGRISYASSEMDTSLECFVNSAKYKTTFYGQISFMTIKKILISFPTLSQFCEPVLNSESKILDSELGILIKNLNKIELEKYGEYIIKKLLKNSKTTDDVFSILQICSSNKKLEKKLKKHNIFSVLKKYKFVRDYVSKKLNGYFDTYGEEEKNFLYVLTHAIILRESSFVHKSVSSAGAVGIMQIMKNTMKNEKSLNHNKMLLNIFKPQSGSSDENVLIGVSHIMSLIKKFGKNIILVSAAYNAGEKNVEKWIKKFGDPRSENVNAVEWIEFIPFTETRNYVKNVCESFLIYTIILKQENLQEIFAKNIGL